jgi:hypothetical protein
MTASRASSLRLPKAHSTHRSHADGCSSDSRDDLDHGLTLPAVEMVASLVSAMAAEALMSALTMVPFAIIALVTVPLSPVVTTVPVTLGSVMVRSAVGSATVSCFIAVVVAAFKLKLPDIAVPV